MYRAGVSYDVVLVTGDTVPEMDARLVLIYGSEIRIEDKQADLALRARRQKVSVDYRGDWFPLHGGLLTFAKSGRHVVCTTTASEAAGIEIDSIGPRVVRMGYDLFQEVAFLLMTGQSVEDARIPTLELHIGLLRDLILDTGISLLEIPPVPAGYDFAVCLTHDIDFVGIRRHKLDHTMWGFLYRSTAGAIRDFLGQKICFTRLLKTWQAAASLPFVYLGWMKDFWVPFDWYLKVEKGLSPTYFFIPFKNRCGEKISASHPERRAAAYDINDIPEWIAPLVDEGCEIGVHGIDAWHSVDKGREELSRIMALTCRSEMGIRMHWLLQDENTYRVLEAAGYAYDSTSGYNETPGYRCGTSQAFRPLGAKTLIELPLHIQDGALFFPKRLGLSEHEAWACCETFITNVNTFGGVLTVLWHDRSPGPERFWGEFYIRLVQKLKSLKAWFGTVGQVVSWFRYRREVRFERVETEDGTKRIRLHGCGNRIVPPLRVRIYSVQSAGAMGMPKFEDITWDGGADIELQSMPGPVVEAPLEFSSVCPRA